MACAKCQKKNRSAKKSFTQGLTAPKKPKPKRDQSYVDSVLKRK